MAGRPRRHCPGGGARRAPSLRRLLAEPDREERLTRLALGPLSQAGTAELARTLAGKRLDEASLWSLTDRVWALSEGNAFMVVATADSAG